MKPPPTITTVEDVRTFFRYLLDDLSVSFHPEDTFHGFVNMETGEPSFTDAEADLLDERMDQARIACGDLDVCAVACEVFEAWEAAR
jgi:hypothetical protein